MLAAQGPGDPNADWSFPAPFRGYVFGDKVRVLLGRIAHVPLFFFWPPASRNDLRFAYPLLWLGRFVLALPLRVGRADGAYGRRSSSAFIVTVIGAHPIIPFNRKKQPLARVRHLVYWPRSYLARAIGVPSGPASSPPPSATLASTPATAWAGTPFSLRSP